jgi:hypothetical protein
MPITSQNSFLADLSAAESAPNNAADSAPNNAADSATPSKQALTWSRYQQYLHCISIKSDPYLDNFYKFQQIKIFGTFAQAVRDGQLSVKSDFC